MIESTYTEELAADGTGSGLEAESDAGEIVAPFNPQDIDVIVQRITMDMLLKRLRATPPELLLTPDFQRRANIWDVKRKSRLIESILLRIPLPSFYLSEDSDGNFSVVDGLQRICAVCHFMDVDLLRESTKDNTHSARLEILELEDLQYLKDLNGRTFKELDRKLQRRIEELEITANVVRAGTPTNVRFNIFARLNQGGVPLTPQEIRNAIFPGKWRDKIRHMAESNNFLEVTNHKIATDRQQDLELVLRYVALMSLPFPFKRDTRQNLDDFLNESVEKKLSALNEHEWDRLQKRFYHSLSAAEKVFSLHAFRKYRKTDDAPVARMSPINRGLFEAELVALSELTDAQVARLIRRNDDVLNGLHQQLKDESGDFAKSLTYATGSGEASNQRIETMRTIFKAVLDASTDKN